LHRDWYRACGGGGVGESELDRLAKRFLAEVHRFVAPTHVMRGAY